MIFHLYLKKKGPLPKYMKALGDNIKMYMPRYYFILFCLLILMSLLPLTSFANNYNNSGFAWYKNNNYKTKSGITLDNPKDKIIIIYNHGGWGGPSWNVKQDSKIVKIAAYLSKKLINGKETILWVNGELHKGGNQEIGIKCAWELGGAHTDEFYECVLNDFPLFNRVEITKAAIIEFVKNGTPRDQIFVLGHSCGAWNALTMEGNEPNIFNAAIAYAPNCWDKAPHSKVRKILIDEITNFDRIDGLVLHGPADGMVDFKSNSTHLRFIGDIKGVNWIELPNHTGNSIIVNGKKCGIKERMLGGWDLKYNPSKSVFNPFDENKLQKKELGRKSQGHMIFGYKCFKHYHPKILNYIAGRL